MAADLDNYKSALDRLSQNTPIAINIEDNVQRLKKLYPPKHHITEDITDHTTSQNITNQNDIDINTILFLDYRPLKSKHARKQNGKQHPNT